MSEERRQSEREFPRRLMAKLKIGPEQLNLRLMDISAGGVGLFSATLDHLTDDVPVQVTIDNEPTRHGVIRYVKPHPYGGYHIGIEWTA